MLLVLWFVLRPRSRGVAVAVWHDGHVLLVRNSYRRGENFPAGGVKRTETPRQAALRELREEVGIAASSESLRRVGEFPTRWEFKRDLCTVFELELDARPDVRVDRREVVWASFAAAEEALAADLSPLCRAYLERRGTGGGPAA